MNERKNIQGFDREMNTKEETPISDQRDISKLLSGQKEKIEYKTVNLYKSDHQRLKLESAKSGRSIVDILSELINENY
ncbi:MAG TPA: plasmid partition protein ParG [Candidatus Dormibacteraeota bacterium]|nr:plasmid partition protein ParG [Candidatus Dormibacteraeota bacterium]